MQVQIWAIPVFKIKFWQGFRIFLTEVLHKQNFDHILMSLESSENLADADIDINFAHLARLNLEFRHFRKREKTSCFKDILKQIWKSANIFVFIWK